MRPMSCRRRGLSAAFVALAIAIVAPAAAGAAPNATAPGAPGAPAFWTPANKQGFGTSTTAQSKLWHTLQGGELTEVYYPDLGTPALRDLQLIVTDGKTFTDRETDATTQHVELVDKRSLTYRQVNTAKSKRYRIVKTYVDRPGAQRAAGRRALRVADGAPLQGLRLRRPGAQQRRQRRQRDDLPRRAADPGRRRRQRARRRPVLRPHLDRLPGRQRRLGRPARRPPDGLAVPLLADRQRRPDRRDEARRPPPPAPAARARLRRHERRRARHRARLAEARLRARGRRLRRRLAPLPGLAQARAGQREALRRRVRRLGHDPRRPRGQDQPRRVHRLAHHAVVVGHRLRGAQVGRLPRGVVARPLPDRHRDDGGRRPRRRRARADLRLRQAAARRRLVRQNTFVDGTPHWDGTQQDEVAFPIVLAWQLGRDDAQTYTQHVKPAADWLVRTGPKTDMDRWENQDGWSPGTIASEIAGLICAAPTSRARTGDDDGRGHLRGEGRRVAAERRGLDGDHQRPVLRRALLPAPDQGRQPQRRQHLLDRRQRPERDGRAQGRRPELPRARAPRRQAPRRPDDRQHDRRRRPAARGRHPERPLLAPGQLRRLRRALRRHAVGLATAGQQARGSGRMGAPGRSSPASAASTTSSPGSRPPRSWRPWPAPPTRAA